MIQYYIKLAFRSLKRNKFYSLISIFCLAIGLGAYTLLANYIRSEQSFDDQHTDKDKIYRVESYFERNGQVTDSWATSSYGYAPAMKKEFPQIEDIVRVNNFDCERVVRYEENVFRESRALLADSNFFSFFSYPLLKGDAGHVLKEPNSVVISESAARKYFGMEDPLGKILHLSTMKTQYDCAVTGIFKDFPRNSTLQASMLISYMTAKRWERESWYMHYAYTYIKTGGPKQVQAIERGFPALAEKYKTNPALKEHTWGIHLIPLTDIHFNPAKPYEVEVKGSKTAIRILSFIALVVLVVSWINYINMFISRALERAGEIGMRKLAGASGRQIFLQFLSEALLVNLAALLLFLGMMAVIIPLSGWSSWKHIFDGFWNNRFIWQTSIASFLAGTLITGAIPAFILRNLDTARVLKNRLSFKNGLGNNLRSTLMVFQYAASMVLIISALTIHKQLHFMLSQDLGVATAQTLVFKSPPKTDSTDEEKMGELKNVLSAVNGVEQVTLSSDVPGKMVGFGMANHRVGDLENMTRMCEMVRVDYNFLPAYKLRLIRGRNFSQSYPTDKEDAVILTETSMRLFGFSSADDAMNGFIYLEGLADRKFKVIGIVQDYHQLSLRENFRPIVFTVFNPRNTIKNQYVSLKISSRETHETADKVRAAFRSFFPQSSFDFFFLDDYYNAQYSQDQQYGQLVLFFSILALLIVCLGLIGLSSFMLLKRKKEIGIRKVVGAGIPHILLLLNSYFFRLVMLALFLAIPMAWFCMHTWLQDFAYRTSIGISVFVVAAVITLLVTIITVSIQSLKIAVVNPIDSLRCD